jgi:hypothetical protein
LTPCFLQQYKQKLLNFRHHFLFGLKVPFFVMKSALFVQANVAVNIKLTSKVPFLFGNFQVFFKKFGQKRAISVCYDGKIFSSPPRRQHFLEKFFRCPFRYPKVPLEVGAPPIF